MPGPRGVARPEVHRADDLDRSRDSAARDRRRAQPAGDMQRNIQLFSNFADGSECIRRLVQMPVSLRTVSIVRSYFSVLLFSLTDSALLVLLTAAISRDRMAVDALFQNRRRLEHHHAARRDRHLGTRLRIATDALALAAYHE
jgi:hypothetical protein